MYTTIERVRTLSWFDDKTNITDEIIKNKILIASWYINSSIGYVYSLPIAFHYDNYILFSWTATSSWTLTITINWVDYDITITSWDTSNIIADNFRIVCDNSDDFIIDDLWFWTKVLLISKSNVKATAYNQVNITIASDEFGVKTKIWVRKKRFPVILEQITAEISTSLLFIDVYWVESQDTWKDGQTRMDIINETLQKLQWVHDSGQSIKIFDEVDNIELSKWTQMTSESYPNDTSDVDTTDPTSPKIFMNKIF